MPIVSDWDFYPSTVDGRPASVYVNLELRRVGPAVGADTQFVVRVAMLDLGPHGMGTAAESAVLFPVEDELEKRLAAHDVIYVGRIRSHGVWEMSFYGPASAGEHVVVEVPDRVCTIDVTSDPDWDYFERMLSPSTECYQWIINRRIVEVLEECGDPLVVPRKVDHWAYFSTKAARDAFVVAAVRDGFAFERVDADEPDNFCARMSRENPATLEEIHEAVMLLVEHARANGGRYDGWESPLEADN